jgi:hypothetical protein
LFVAGYFHADDTRPVRMSGLDPPLVGAIA